MLELGETEDGTTVYYAGVDADFNLVIPYVNTYDRQTIPFMDQLTENINQSVFFSLSIPVFNNFSTKNSVEYAKVSVLRSEYNQQAASQILRTSIESAWADAVAAQKTLAAQEAALNAAELAFANTELKFEAGTISALEYADARTRLDNARIGALRTRYDLVFKSKILDFYQGKSISL
jgi:outer membrane protein